MAQEKRRFLHTQQAKVVFKGVGQEVHVILDPLASFREIERELEEHLAKSAHPSEVRVYPDAGHAFMNDTRPEMHRPAAAADAWPRLVTFLRHHLARV